MGPATAAGPRPARRLRGEPADGVVQRRRQRGRRRVLARDGSDRSNGYVVFGRSWGTPTDEMAVTGCTIAALRWNDWDTPASARSDYDLELYERSADETTLLVARSGTADQHGGAAPLEQVTPTCPTIGRKLFLKVRYVGGGTADDDVIEILDYDSGLQFRQAPYSAARPGERQQEPVSDRRRQRSTRWAARRSVPTAAAARPTTAEDQTRSRRPARRARRHLRRVQPAPSASAPAAAGIARVAVAAAAGPPRRATGFCRPSHAPPSPRWARR